MIPSIPGYVQVPKGSAQTRRAASNVDPQFVESALAAIDASSRVQQAVGVTSEDLRTDIDDASRWAAVRDVVREMLKGLDGAVQTRKYRVGFAALQTYSVARSVARSDDQAHLLVHIEAMKHYNRYGRRRAKKDTTTTPEPTPTPTPTPQQ